MFTDTYVIVYVYMHVIYYTFKSRSRRHRFFILFFHVRLNSTCPFSKEHPSSSHQAPSSQAQARLSLTSSQRLNIWSRILHLALAFWSLPRQDPRRGTCGTGRGWKIIGSWMGQTTLGTQFVDIKWAVQLKNPSPVSVDTIPTQLHDKDSLSLKLWNILEPKSSITLLPSLHKESWCCKSRKMQRPSAATTRCKLFPSLVASEGTRTVATPTGWTVIQWY